MGVDTAVAAEIMLRCAGIELIEPELALALNDLDTVQRNRGNDGTFTAAHRTITAPGVDNAIRQIQLQHHRSAMTGCAVFGFDFSRANFLDHGLFLPK